MQSFTNVVQQQLFNIELVLKWPGAGIVLLDGHFSFEAKFLIASRWIISVDPKH